MSKFQLIFTLFSIIYGLLLTEIFSSLHRLLRHRRVVRWHWLPLASVWFITLVMLKNWWRLSLNSSDAYWGNIVVFLGYCHLMLLMYLLVSAALPDAVPAGGVDLKVYYLANRRYFWGLFLGMNAVALALVTFKHYLAGSVVSVENLVVNGLIMALILPLMVSRRHWVHALIVTLFTTELLLEVGHLM